MYLQIFKFSNKKNTLYTYTDIQIRRIRFNIYLRYLFQILSNSKPTINRLKGKKSDKKKIRKNWKIFGI